jgi:hypothetical protein
VKLSDRDREELCKWYAKGATITPLSVVYGISPKAIYGLLRRRGIPVRTDDRRRQRNSPHDLRDPYRWSWSDVSP